MGITEASSLAIVLNERISHSCNADAIRLDALISSSIVMKFLRTEQISDIRFHTNPSREPRGPYMSCDVIRSLSTASAGYSKRLDVSGGRSDFHIRPRIFRRTYGTSSFWGTKYAEDTKLSC
jgi:hypothetical protein